MTAAAFVTFVSCGDSETTSPEVSVDSGTEAMMDARAPVPDVMMGPSEPESFLPEWFDCSADSDCTIVRTQGCVACLVDAVNKEHEEDFIRAAQSSNALNCRPGPCPPLPKAAVCTEGKCDEVVDCAILGAFCGSFAKCIQLRGRTCETDAAPKLVELGCLPKDPSAVSQRTCAEDPETGNPVIFASTQIPDGWAPCESSECP